jgi:glutamyl-tRNA reductase
MPHREKTIIAVIGMNHKTAAVETRECFSLHKDEYEDFYKYLNHTSITEAVYVATCNRIEIYIASKNIETAILETIQLMESISNKTKNEFEDELYIKEDLDAIEHLFTVICALDSMVIGENEIVGQIKESFTEAVKHRKSGIVLNKLFHQAFKTTKQVRTDTGIAKNSVSVAYIASDMVRRKFTDLSQIHALLIGAGEMGELILKYMNKFGTGEITIANRSREKAENIAEGLSCSVDVINLEEIENILHDVDVIITSVSAPHYMITEEIASPVMLNRKKDHLMIMDIAVPRNVDPAVSSIDNIDLYNIDDLKDIADKNLTTRQKEIEFAYEIIMQNVKEFEEWYDEQSAVPAIVTLQNKFDDIRMRELELCRRRKLKNLSEEEFQAVAELTQQIMSKTLHNPIMNLKRHFKGEAAEEISKDVLHKRTRFVEDLFTK